MALFHGFHAQGPMGGEGLADTWPFDSVLSSKCGEFLLCLPLHWQRNSTGPRQPKRLRESGLTNDSPCLPPARKPPFGKACPVSRKHQPSGSQRQPLFSCVPLRKAVLTHGRELHCTPAMFRQRLCCSMAGRQGMAHTPTPEKTEEFGKEPQKSRDGFPGI
jgi:hypothetical protein